MQVAQYTYQSPSTSSVQVGRLDPNSVKDNSTNTAAQPPKSTNETLIRAQDFQATQTKEVTPTVITNSIDIYV
jgi:hypothetical protein